MLIYFGSCCQLKSIELDFRVGVCNIRDYSVIRIYVMHLNLKTVFVFGCAMKFVFL